MVATPKVGTEITPIVKHIVQEKINLFEACGVRGGGREGGHGGGFHTDPEAAMRSLGIATPIASGRMQTSFTSEALRRYFGAQVFNHGGTVDIRFTKPVVHGDTVTVKGKVTETKAEGNKTRVNLEVWCENQNGEKTSAGTGSVLIPN